MVVQAYSSMKKKKLARCAAQLALVGYPFPTRLMSVSLLLFFSLESSVRLQTDHNTIAQQGKFLARPT
jgi:hypothetical protein